jgi:hypothetical protein
MKTIGLKADYDAQRTRLAERLAAADAERAQVEQELAEAAADGQDTSALGARVVALDQDIRAMRSASVEIDRREMVADAEKAAQDKLAAEKQLDRALVALEKATVAVADDVLMLGGRLGVALEAEAKAGAAAGACGLELSTYPVMRKVRDALFAAGYRHGDRMDSADARRASSGADEALRARRTTKAIRVDPFVNLPGGRSEAGDAALLK